MGHALGFNPSNPAFKRYKLQGYIDDPEVVKYYGSPVPIDEHDHLAKATDPESGKGAFGNDWGGVMPDHRWWITKLDLLVLQAVGYQLRATGPFALLTFQTQSLAAPVIGAPYSAHVTASGGMPIYNWTVSSGSLPPGLSLDPFSGRITGTPTAAGQSDFTIRVQDYHEGSAGVERQFALVVASR
jgi:hypothetical protein